MKGSDKDFDIEKVFLPSGFVLIYEPACKDELLLKWNPYQKTQDGKIRYAKVIKVNITEGFNFKENDVVYYAVINIHRRLGCVADVLKDKKSRFIVIKQEDILMRYPYDSIPSELDIN